MASLWACLIRALAISFTATANNLYPPQAVEELTPFPSGGCRWPLSSL